MTQLRSEIADILARLPVRCDNDPELDKLRRFEAADAILALVEEEVRERASEAASDAIREYEERM